MRLLAVAALAGCTPNTPPVDFATVDLALICLLNCPISVTLADEGNATDATPIEHAHVLPENMQTYTARPVTPGKK